MSRFFVGGSSSEEESDYSDQSEGEENAPIKAPARFAKPTDYSSSDSDTEKKRVVKSTVDKRYEEFKEVVQKIKNHTNINDWSALSNDFDALNKALSKASSLVSKEGIPADYIKGLIILEEAIKSTQENKPAMNATNTKNFNSMKQKIKKHNKNYEKQIEDHKAKPAVKSDKEDEDSESEEDTAWMDEPDSEEDTPKQAKPAASDSEEEPSDDEQDSDESSDDDDASDRAKKWMKKETISNIKTREKRDDKDKVAAKSKKTVGKSDQKEEKKVTEMNPEEIKKKLAEVLSNRGKKGYDSSKQVEKLNELLSFAKNPDQQVEILIHLITAQFDAARSSSVQMPVTLWKACYNNVVRILLVLEQNPAIVLHESETAIEAINDDEDNENKAVAGNLVGFIERLEDELTKSFQAIDPHTQEYVQRLQDENSLGEIMEKIQTYYTKVSNFRAASQIAERRMEHIYYKFDADKPAEGEAEKKKDNAAVLEELAALVMAHGDERLKTRAMLCNIYSYAVRDRYYEARDMMLMSHLQDSIAHMDISTQILFNRTQVQIGLCAFRNNLIKNAFVILSEVHAGGKVKELLAQGVTNTRLYEKSPEQEKLERKRQLPYHMHINLELLEAVHLICAMLLEVPNHAAHAFDVKKKITSRFDRLLEIYERQVFTGPPENTRDVIIQASKSLSRGDWKRCEELLLGLPVWALVSKSDQVKAMLRRKIQEEGLRTYLFTYSAYYKSMSLEQLCDMFELPKNNVHSIVSKMMVSEELHASWDQPTGAIVMHGVEPTRLQYLAMQLADKAAGFVELNERNLDNRGAGYGYKGEGRQWQGDRQRGERRGGDRDQRQGGGDRRRGGDRQGGDRRGGDRRGGYQGGYQNQGQRRGGYQNRGDRENREDGQRRQNNRT